MPGAPLGIEFRARQTSRFFRNEHATLIRNLWFDCALCKNQTGYRSPASRPPQRFQFTSRQREKLTSARPPCP